MGHHEPTRLDRVLHNREGSARIGPEQPENNTHATEPEPSGLHPVSQRASARPSSAPFESCRTNPGLTTNLLDAPHPDIERAVFRASHKVRHKPRAPALTGCGTRRPVSRGSPEPRSAVISLATRRVRGSRVAYRRTSRNIVLTAPRYPPGNLPIGSTLVRSASPE